MATPEEDYSSLPLTERVTHKIWKVRVAAYEELTKLFKKSDSESDFRPYEGFMKNIATDANAVAQETGLTTLLAFVENAPNPLRVRASIIPAVVDKGFGSARAGTKNKAIELILLYIEVDTPDPVVGDVLVGLKAKQPKLVATTVFALKEMIRFYGAKTVNVKPILKTIPKIFAHTDKNVRSEGTQLVIELYKWLGKAIDPHLSELKPVQVKELNEAFEKLPQEKPKQERLLRSQIAEAEAAAEAGKGEEDEAEEEKEIDAYDLAEPVDVLSKISKDFYTGLGSTKWKERKEALEGLLEICKTPKIADNNYSELIAALAKRITDANILVVTLAANVIEAIALGLREAFAKYKPVVIGPLIERLKERRQSVVDALSAALDAVFLSVTISDITEDILAAGKHKNPQVKSESMKWLVRCIKNTKTSPQKAEIKSLTEMMVKASEDSFEPVRVSAFEGLGTMMKVIGEKAMNTFLEGLDDIKKGKIKEYYDKAEVKIKFSAAKKPPPAAASSKGDAPKGKPAEKKSAAKKEAGSAPKKTAAKPGGPPKKAPSAKAPSAAAPPPKKGGKAKAEEVIRYKFADEDVETRFAELVSEDQTAELSEKNWKLRLAAIENLQNALEGMDPSEVEAELVVRFLSKKPGWKENNFQVLSKVFNIIEMLGQKIPSFGKPTAALAIPILVEKLGDIKLKKSAGDALMTFSEKISLQFILSQAYDPLRKAKAPKTLADSLTWIHGAIMEFGIAGLQVRELIEFLKFALSSSNAAVRTNSVTVLGALRIFVGPDIRTFVQDLNPTQLATIDSEFEKVADEAPPKALRASIEVSGSGTSGKNTLEELFPKVDIGAQFTSKMMAECNDDKWKVRKDALEQVLAIVDANKKIKPNLGDFVPILKARLGDSNKNLLMMALDITGKIATAMGKPFERHVKILVGPITAVLTDQKATVRGSAISALDALSNACGLDPLIGSFSTSLATENPLLRKDLLNWLSDRLKEAAESDKKNALPDLSPMVQPILSCLQDRNGDVRKAAQSCLDPIVKSAGYDYVVAKCGDLKGAVKQTIMPMIEAVRPTGPSGPAARKDAKKVKSRLAAPSGKDKADADDEIMEDDEPAKLPPGLVLRPPTNSALNKPTASLANPLSAANPNSSSIPTNGPPSQLNGPPPSGISRLQSPNQRGGIPSGIGRGLTPSRLQFSRIRPGMNGANGQIPAASNDSIGEIESKKDLSNMEADKLEHSMSVNNEINALPKQRVFMVDIIITKIMSTEFQQSIEALKELDKHLNASPESIIPDVDELVNALAFQLRISYTQLQPQSQSLIRLCKHLVNALVLLFSNKDLASAVSQDSLDRLLSELAHRLLDPNLTAVDGGAQLSKAINVSMVKVLEHSNRNRTYSALISILGKSSSNLRDLDAATAATQTKFTELIMKCLWKLAKSVQENLKTGTLLPNQLLFDLNEFFKAIPPAEWKRRAAEKVLLGEMPLRTVKTLLLELVTGLGGNVYEHLDLIEDPQRSYVYPYLHHMLEATRKKDKQAGNQAITDNNASSRPSSISSARSISSVSSDLAFSTTDSARASPARELSSQQTPTQTSLRNSLPARNSPINELSTKSSPPPRGSPIPDVPGHINETMSNASEPVSPASPRTPMTPKFPTPTSSARSSGSHEVEMNARLTQIFLKIGTREETKKGIYELYEFQKQHPEMEGKITTQLSRTGTHFQSYIRRGLANIATEEEEKERANVIAEAKKNLFPQDDNHSENNVNQSEDVAYKQKLLRLQQVFGYRETGNE
ncbi:armadillo-type protein [Glomus cerebriforme]|uniref:Armadillo-type protein n=1 Tax=Glomus cerebriforme TaxID=658196 RepID=A0A397TBB5_9GLOM|nr:armadillo-type protein [Glomus cerebriforme]